MGDDVQLQYEKWLFLLNSTYSVLECIIFKNRQNGSAKVKAATSEEMNFKVIKTDEDKKELKVNLLIGDTAGEYNIFISCYFWVLFHFSRLRNADVEN